MQQQQISLTNSSGLHARPAAQFVQKAAAFKSRVTVKAGDKSADAKSILQILSLGAKQGMEICITADGPDEAECVKTLSELIQSGFGE